MPPVKGDPQVRQHFPALVIAQWPQHGRPLGRAAPRAPPSPPLFLTTAASTGAAAAATPTAANSAPAARAWPIPATATGRSPSTPPPPPTADEIEARIALRHFNQSLALGFIADPRQKTADYLHLKATTMTRHRDYVENDLIPALDNIPSTT
ncbi:hypothetical protein [Kitasatospora sp. NPDC057198]|uniref:hypothetical protein n=1 Tax=Kitasatospora sp. NPDC057198 TaxID=3346046 RepID=UPI00362F4DCB